MKIHFSLRVKRLITAGAKNEITHQLVDTEECKESNVSIREKVQEVFQVFLNELKSAGFDIDTKSSSIKDHFDDPPALPKPEKSKKSKKK